MNDALRECVSAALGHTPPKRLGVAVSGGGDSVALLAILAEFTGDHDIELHVVSVDHGIRPEAKQEISFVTDLCAGLGLQHHVENWTGWTGQGNFQAVAREGRYKLMSDWAHANEINHIALGHTADDQAETFVMRLARGAGVDGLSAMAPCRVNHGITWVRPFLGIQRADLRTYLRAQKMEWCEDPSNENRDYDRIKARDALAVLGTLGVTVEGVVQVARNLTMAREALNAQTFQAARAAVTVQFGAISIDKRQFQTLPEEICRRLLLNCVQWISGNPYGARGPTIARALKAVTDGQTTTLDGCQVSTKAGQVWVYREFNAVRDTMCDVSEPWDGRWRVCGPDDRKGLDVRALGFDALANIEGWREIGLPRAALASTPSVWYKDELVAAPIAQPDAAWSANLENGADTYFSALLSH